VMHGPLALSIRAGRFAAELRPEPMVTSQDGKGALAGKCTEAA
jgi:hypothetical protein